MIDLSIVIPIYNVSGFLAECVESLYGPQLAEDRFEVLLVDDGSTDDSPVVMTRLADRHPNIRVLRQENQGVSVARNLGIREARGRYIEFVDADDRILPEPLARMLDFALRHETDMTRGEVVKVPSEQMADFRLPDDADGKNGADGKTGADGKEADPQILTGEEAYRTLFDPRQGYSVSYLLRTEFLRGHALRFLPGVKMTEDLEFVEHCLLMARRFAALPLTFYLYRQHEGSCLYTMNVSKLLDMNTVDRALMSRYDLPGFSPATRRRQAECLWTHLSVTLWYLTHHRNLYAMRMTVVSDLHRKVPRFPRDLPIFPRISLWALRHCPRLYLGMRFALARKKY
jgi:glycosyltransferase involved in cell wall biosynthesis